MKYIKLRKRLYTAVLFGTAVLLSLAASEMILRTAFDPARILDGDALWEYRWRKQYASDEARLTTQEYGFDQYDALLGWRPRENFRSALVRTNSFGARADREYKLMRDSESARIIAVGDSFTWGEEVANEHTFMALLESRLAGTEAINLAVHGYGTGQQLLRLRDLGFSLKPDIVILGFHEDNFYRNTLRFRDYAKPQFVLRGGALILENVPVPTPREITASEQDLPDSFMWVLARRFARKLSIALGQGLDQSEGWRVTQALLDSIKNETHSVGASLVVIFIPYGALDNARGPIEPLVTDWARDRKVDYINLSEHFEQMPLSARRMLYSGHWTIYGNSVVAELVSRHISERYGLERLSD